MNKELIYKVLGENDKNILLSHVSHLSDICNEIMSFYRNDCMDQLSYVSFVPGRLRGISSILISVYDRYKQKVDGIKDKEISSAELKSYANNLDSFIILVKSIEKNMELFLFDNKESKGLVNDAEKIIEFIREVDL